MATTNPGVAGLDTSPSCQPTDGRAPLLAASRSSVGLAPTLTLQSYNEPQRLAERQLGTPLDV